nr:secreted antigen Ts8B1 [Hymenolepis microstoma]
MKPIFFFALVFLAFTVANVRAQNDDEAGPRSVVLKFLGKVQNYFKTDPIGQKISQQFTELREIAREVRKRLRQRLGKYLKELQEQN